MKADNLVAPRVRLGLRRTLPRLGPGELILQLFDLRPMGPL